MDFRSRLDSTALAELADVTNRELALYFPHLVGRRPTCVIVRLIGAADMLTGPARIVSMQMVLRWYVLALLENPRANEEAFQVIVDKMRELAAHNIDLGRLFGTSDHFDVEWEPICLRNNINVWDLVAELNSHLNPGA